MPEIDAQYRTGAAEGRLVVQKCPQCEHLRFPPAAVCPRCLTKSDEWETLSGRGRVWSWIRIHKQYFRDTRREPPYNVALIQLDEGPMMISAIVGEPEQLSCGASVQAVFPGNGSDTIPWFQLRQGL